ncbi:hypothetical protein B7463_g3634, partial [Scytalidium lignicola]
MLLRAAARSLNASAARANAAGVRIPSTLWTRGMARNNKSNHRPNKPLDASKDTGSSISNASKSPAPSSPFEAAQKAKAERQKAAAEAAASSQNASSQSDPESSATTGSETPNQPLPDLTQGIPSTLEFETSDRSSKRDRIDPTEAEEAAEPHIGGRSRGELPASAYISSSERKRARAANYMYASFAILSIAGTVYLGRNWESEEEEKKYADAPSGWGLGLMWNRAKARLGDQISYYNEPAFRKLLPDVDPIFERPYTLVLSLEDLLIHNEWTREHGWRLAKRPGVDYFLRYLSQYYELVIFTSQPWAVAEPIIRKLDPYHIVTWPLFREATLYENGEYVKDLSYLNRDLSKVILIDTKSAHAKHQPENAIILPKWGGDPKDKELVSLIPFLEYIHTMADPDVRKTLQSFDGKHIPTEFARREVIARKKFQEQLAEEQKKRPKRSGLGLLTNALGVKHQPMMMDPAEQTPAEAFAQGKMLQDMARERGQRNYEALEKEIRENGEKWLKEEAAMEEKAKEEGMKAMKSGFTGWFGGGSGSASA